MKNKDDKNWADAITAKAEFIPMVNKEDEAFLLTEQDLPSEMPVLPLRDAMIFPGVIMPVSVSRPKSLRLLKAAQRKDTRIAVFSQLGEDENPAEDQLFPFGVIARVVNILDFPNSASLAVLQGTMKCRLDKITAAEPHLFGQITPIEENLKLRHARQFAANMRLLRGMHTELQKRKGTAKDEALATAIRGIKSDKILINFIATHMELGIFQKSSLLEANDYESRLSLVLKALESELQYMNLHDEIQERTRTEMDRQQREYFLNQEMRVIQNELGGNPADMDLQELTERAEKMNWSPEADKAFKKGIQKLQRTPMQTPDYTVELNHLNMLLDLPWHTYTRDNLRPSNARKVLDRDHYGIDQVKDRIVEHIAVLSLKKDMKSPIICLVGPPGTGKTSLGKSIAEAMKRNYVRVALGGVHDESEIRGHRRTYVGAMPGRILQSIKKAGSSNPVFILDEIDKVQSNSLNGDPTSALLEALDPEQNNAFHDNYLDVPYDLSKALFIATANSTSTIQPALLDRMEVIELSGYILEEKLEIAKRHLIPKQLDEHGFDKKEIKFSTPVLSSIINDYTRESGVRQLDKAIAKIVRKKAVRKANGEEVPRDIQVSELKDLLGLPIHNSERCGKEARVGVVTGLAWTQVGGEILFVESSISKGKGTLSLTGNLGDVMKESATLAFEYLKSNAARFGIADETIENSNIHIHVPEGATPKDGPSAGITMFVAMISAFSQKKVKSHVAMTGEITLRGAVTPVGGIKEKILAAKRAGITDIILCEANRRDIEDIKPEFLNGIRFHYINEMSEALPLALAQ